MIVLDTNVLSELMRPQPNESVLNWIATYQVTSLFTTALTKAEIFYGLEILPQGKRRNTLIQIAQLMFELDFAERILTFDSDAASHFATISAKRKILGRPISQIDAQIAAIVLSHNATLATRNVADFDYCDINIINPWN